MSLRSLLGRIGRHERLNFLLTNRIPRRLLSRFMGWFSQIEHPLLCDLSIHVWRLFTDDLDLGEARKTRFRSLHDCFVRELKEGARVVDPDPSVLVSPCDAVVVSGGRIRGTELLQAKGRAYTLEELLGDPELVRGHVDGSYVTLRLKSTMYHRFHAPHDCRVEEVRYFPGDAWNVNPPALRRIDRLYVKNERAVLRTRLEATGHRVTLVPVGAVLVASIRLHFVEVPRRRRRHRPIVIPCDAALRKGEEMGWFQHGSTMIVFTPPGMALCANVQDDTVVRMGQPLFRLP